MDYKPVPFRRQRLFPQSYLIEGSGAPHAQRQIRHFHIRGKSLADILHSAVDGLVGWIGLDGRVADDDHAERVWVGAANKEEYRLKDLNVITTPGKKMAFYDEMIYNTV